MNRVFPQYLDKTLEGFQCDHDSYLTIAAGKVGSYIDDLKVMKGQGLGMTFAGQNGVGKTHLACVVMSAAMDAGCKIECIELSTYIDMHLEMFQVNNSHYEEDEERAYELRKRIRYAKSGADFLLLDDLGREHESQSGWSSGQVFSLLRYRYNRKLPTLITTNLSFQELDARYTEGLSSFLQEATILVEMKGGDYRASRAARD